MTAGPLNRLTGVLGLLALVPTAIMSAMGHVTATDTAIRAGVTLALVIAVRKLVAFYLAVTASSFERLNASEEEVSEQQAEVERRRQSDLGTVAS